MIISSGTMCDVCGHYILLPLDPDEMVNYFAVKGIKRDLHCHNKCKADVLAAGNDWRKLPEDGPLYKALFVKSLEVEADAHNDDAFRRYNENPTAENLERL